MRGAFLFAAAAMALAGCQSEAEKHAAATGEIDVTNATTAEAAGLMEAAAEKNGAQPGQWQGELKIESVDLGKGGDSQRQLEMAKGMERKSSECRTAEQLRPFDIEKLEKAAGQCTIARLVSKGGKVDAQIECKRDGAPDTSINLAGTSSPSAFDVRTTYRTGTPGQDGYSLIKLRTTGKRLGACQG
jgi:hypothetical protein